MGSVAKLGVGRNWLVAGTGGVAKYVHTFVTFVARKRKRKEKRNRPEVSINARTKLTLHISKATRTQMLRKNCREPYVA